MGLGAGGIIGIILAVLVVAAAAGFLLYRRMQARADPYDGGKPYDDYPASKPVELAATQSPAEYDFTSGGTPAGGASGGGDTGKSGASSIAMLNPQMASSPGAYYGGVQQSHQQQQQHQQHQAQPQPLYQPQQVQEEPSPFEMSQVKYNQMPSLDSSQSSPPFHATDEVPLPSKRSPTRFEEESTEFGGGSLAGASFAGSYAESYAESYSQSYRGTYGAQSLLGSFDQGHVDTRPFGESLTDGAPRGRESSADASDAGAGGDDKSHWLSAMDDMRGTNDSYAMLESGSFDRTSALSRFSTDSDMHARDTNY
jgi:hypothetical protein